ncbi:MAG: hypothetical protein GY719_41445 [bacterium]|nr:hypothetical protein [bacterium]
MCKPQTLALLVGLLLAASSAAQEEATAFELSFPNPGARSLGFGGAFVALADDATAAFANPAGLTQLLEPEVTLEIRGQGVSTPIGSPAIDLSLGVSGQAFLAFVYPWKKFSVAAFQNEFGNFSSNSRFVFAFPEGGGFDVQTANDFQITNTGLSGSYRVNERFSLGAGIFLWQGDFNAVTVQTRSSPDPAVPDTLIVRESSTNDDRDFGFNAGFLWQFARRWRFGGVARQGPELALHSQERSGPIFPDFESLPLRTRSAPIRFPSVVGLGVAYKSKQEKLTLSFEWDFVRYSNVLDSLDGLPDRAGFDLDDGHEIHVGLEYVITASRPVIVLRAGGWRDPDHRLRYAGEDPVNRTIFRAGRDQTHFAFGLGFAFKHLKLDLAFDDGDSVNTGSFSVIYSFW